ncbi:HAD-IB family hydrolase (plasmid) [Legionella lytica]|uniref:HAD-IB family hydrolase n=1 Tax=Legionella lytica TaxID=96232 RepID=A0ABY4YD12_9GAMM|nr:HAD-IB family hydrolase [Legionella lytica]USQ15491.1 HAD-IB family hydrolase [Legionella lytica]USQ15512.1 HAD-IB family hydrolase [Legionella lytica]
MSEKINDNQTIALFDFDGTITKKSTTTPFLKFISGHFFLPKLLFRLPSLISYHCHFSGLDQLNNIIANTFFKGLKREHLYQAGEHFSDQMLPSLVKNTALERLKWHQDQGHYCILATAAFNVYIDYWAKINGFNAIVSTQIHFDTQNVASGTIHGQSCNGAEKLNRVLELIGNEPRIIYAYGDSSGDAEMLAYATHAHYQIFK